MKIKITPEQNEAIEKLFAPYAYKEVAESGSIFINGGTDYAGDDLTFEIMPNGEVWLEKGNALDGYELELVTPA